MARQGQIIELAKDRFRLRWYVGRVNGRRQYRSETFSGGKRAAAKRLREILGDKNRGVRPETRTLNASSMTTRAFCPRRLGSGGGGAWRCDRFAQLPRRHPEYPLRLVPLAGPP